MKKEVLLAILLFAIVLTVGCLDDTNDRDGDGIDNSRETEGWIISVVYPREPNENVTIYQASSDPNKEDTDNDGLTDIEELLFSGGISTDPTKNDTDNDGLTDLEEHILGTNPTHWQHDVDEDLFIDYDEIVYYKSKGLNKTTILEYLQTDDIDDDGAIDGFDIDPFRDLKAEVRITGLHILTTAILDGTGTYAGIVEVEINITLAPSHGTEWIQFNETFIPGENRSFNLTKLFDLKDQGIVSYTDSTYFFSIVVKDSDNGEGFQARDYQDGISEYDFIQVFEFTNAPSIYAVDFNVNTDFNKYHTMGTDGELWFEVIDRSIAKS